MKKHLLPLLAPLLSALVALLLYLFPLSTSVSTSTGNHLHAWACPLAFYAYVPLLVLALAWAFWSSRKLTPNPYLRPLTWLPAVLLGSYSSEWLGIRFAALILPFGTAAIAATSLSAFLNRPENPPSNHISPRRQLALFTLATALLLFLFSQHIFFHATGGGDVKHYTLQTRNLLQYHTLDLRQQFPDIDAKFKAMTPEVAARTSLSHIRTNPRGQLFSYHSYGFPLLCAPFEWLLGNFGHHLVRFLIALFAALGCRTACLALGVRTRFANLASLLLTFSAPVLLYSLAYLPEGIGCALAAWAFWGILAQTIPTQRTRATLTCALATATLPFFHIRFLPLAGILAACFGIEGLCFTPNEPWKKKLLRLALFSITCFLAWGLLYASQQYMFAYPIDGQAAGAAYNYKKILLREPLAMWGIIANKRSLGSVIPFLYWLLPATLLTPFFQRNRSRQALYATLTTATVLLTCCSTPAALAGACIPGRYLLQSLPILLPFGALAIQEARPPARLWALFLASLAVLISFFLLPTLEQGKLVHITFGIRSIHTPLNAFWEPNPEYVLTPNNPSYLYGSLYIIALLLSSALLLLRLRIPAALTLLASLILGLTSQSIQDKLLPLDNSFALTFHPTWTHFRAQNQSNAQTPFEFFAPKTPTNQIYKVYTADPSQNELFWEHARKDIGIRHNYTGYSAARIQGSIAPDSALLLSLWQGSLQRWISSSSLPPGPFDYTFIFPTQKGLGDSYLRMALTNNFGSVTLHSFEIYPFSPPMLKSLPPFPSTSQLHILPR